jgi:hypothetical protein
MSLGMTLARTISAIPLGTDHDDPLPWLTRQPTLPNRALK